MMFVGSSNKMCMVLFAKYLGMTCNKKDKNMPFDDVKIIKILIFPTELS